MLLLPSCISARSFVWKIQRNFFIIGMFFGLHFLNIVNNIIRNKKLDQISQKFLYKWRIEDLSFRGHDRRRHTKMFSLVIRLCLIWPHKFRTYLGEQGGAGRQARIHHFAISPVDRGVQFQSVSGADRSRESNFTRARRRGIHSAPPLSLPWPPWWCIRAKEMVTLPLPLPLLLRRDLERGNDFREREALDRFFSSSADPPSVVDNNIGSRMTFLLERLIHFLTRTRGHGMQNSLSLDVCPHSHGPVCGNPLCLRQMSVEGYDGSRVLTIG